ncbi:hypothetical protein [Methanoregula sp.]|uniref:hypothetical protein n=1 Tax=Methanoregula sp. TaxID=2052170 RepID=UPI00236FB2BA|nr:hypothetical protein [Methanoregula sp.]MDD1686389.1 hypothetical protein [Methanoregula sp.]
MTLKYIFVTTRLMSGEKNAALKHTGNDVSKAKVEALQKAVKGACFSDAEPTTLTARQKMPLLISSLTVPDCTYQNRIHHRNLPW